MMEPAARTTMSPGTMSLIGTSASFPSRRTTALAWTISLSLSAASEERCSWNQARRTLIRIMPPTTMAALRSPMRSETMQITRSWMTRGSFTRSKMFRKNPRRFSPERRFGPNSLWRSSNASAESPVFPVPSSARASSASRRQTVLNLVSYSGFAFAADASMAVKPEAFEPALDDDFLGKLPIARILRV